MERIDSSRAKRIIEDSEIKSKTSETHFLFGRSDVFSYEEDGSVYTLVETQEQTYLIHDFTSCTDTSREISEVEKCEAVDFLEKTGHRPFMRLDIERYNVETDNDSFVVEKVDQLGFFSNKESDTGRNYGELLKKKMLRNEDEKEKVKKGAREVLNLS